MKSKHPTYWQMIWKRFRRHSLSILAIYIILLFLIAGIYAPLLASSKPIAVQFEGRWYFPLFRYLFFSGYYTKGLDIFYNLLMFTTPLFLLSHYLFKNQTRLYRWSIGAIFLIQIFLFVFCIFFPLRDPAADPALNLERQKNLQEKLRNPQNPPRQMTWKDEVHYLSPYAKLNLLLRYQLYKEQQDHLKIYQSSYLAKVKQKGQEHPVFPSLWNLTYQPKTDPHAGIEPESAYQQDRLNWLETKSKEIRYKIMPLIRPFHWEDDAGGDQELNQLVRWHDLTRINRKDMVASLIFGIRISLSVGLLSIGLALLIGIPIGAFSGYYGGKLDLIVYRLIEIWESMPTFFMLLMVVAFLQSKSIFLVIAIIGLFGWTSFSRFIRGEFFRQKQMLYTEACHAMGYPDRTIIFSQLLPNAIPALLTLVPFAIMGAITSEAGLSFLGLGEEGSNSWGVLMDEGRSAFPSESYLLWPPAILLTILLVSIALVGDGLRDALDPKQS